MGLQWDRWSHTMFSLWLWQAYKWCCGQHNMHQEMIKRSKKRSKKKAVAYGEARPIESQKARLGGLSSVISIDHFRKTHILNQNKPVSKHTKLSGGAKIITLISC